MFPVWVAAIWKFRLPFASDIVGSITTDIFDPENIVFAFEIFLLPGLQAESLAIPVLMAAILDFLRPFRSEKLPGVSLLRSPTPKICYLNWKLGCYLVYKLSYKYVLIFAAAVLSSDFRLHPAMFYAVDLRWSLECLDKVSLSFVSILSTSRDTGRLPQPPPLGILVRRNTFGIGGLTGMGTGRLGQVGGH